MRFLEAEEYGDEWYVERFREGYTQNGTTKMPAFGELLGQEAAWAIRTYIETRPDGEALAERSDELKALRDQLAAWASDRQRGRILTAQRRHWTRIAAGIGMSVVGRTGGGFGSVAGQPPDRRVRDSL